MSRVDELIRRRGCTCSSILTEDFHIELDTMPQNGGPDANTGNRDGNRSAGNKVPSVNVDVSKLNPNRVNGMQRAGDDKSSERTANSLHSEPSVGKGKRPARNDEEQA